MEQIKNFDFSAMENGAKYPAGWDLKSAEDALLPNYRFETKDGHGRVLLSGNGSKFCMGHFFTNVKLENGHTYKIQIEFEKSAGFDPDKHLLVSVQGSGFNSGVHEYTVSDGIYHGECIFLYENTYDVEVELRATYRFAPDETVTLHRLSIAECEPIKPRPARIAVVRNDVADLAYWEELVDFICQSDKPDLLLLPETFTPCDKCESYGGKTMQFLSRKAAQHGIYLAGTQIVRDRENGQMYNTCFIYDRGGEVLGSYNKIHPYTPEITVSGVMPGEDVRVFETDFGKIGVIICYDSWFTDVTQLLALKGAELILFPNAAYFTELMPARSADNCVRFAVSSLLSPVGLWDTAGREVANRDAFTTCSPNNNNTFRRVSIDWFKNAEIHWATFDLTQSPSPHNWGGNMMSAPGNRRCRRDTLYDLYSEIQKELNRY